MRTSDEIGKIAAALATALPAIQNATKDAENPHFKSNYASLPAVLDATKPTLAEHGIVVLQAPGWDGGVCTLTTRLLHVSGEWIESTGGSPVSKSDPQGVGSAITYLRRYALAAMCGITQEDDDGNVASGKPAPITQAQWDALRKDAETLALDGHITEEAASKVMLAVTSKDESKYDRTRAFLDKKMAR